MAYVCPHCQRISYRPEDEQHQYCAACGTWTAECAVGRALTVSPLARSKHLVDAAAESWDEPCPRKAARPWVFLTETGQVGWPGVCEEHGYIADLIGGGQIRYLPYWLELKVA